MSAVDSRGVGLASIPFIPFGVRLDSDQSEDVSIESDGSLQALGLRLLKQLLLLLPLLSSSCCLW